MRCELWQAAEPSSEEQNRELWPKTFFDILKAPLKDDFCFGNAKKT